MKRYLSSVPCSGHFAGDIDSATSGVKGGLGKYYGTSSSEIYPQNISTEENSPLIDYRLCIVNDGAANNYRAMVGALITSAESQRRSSSPANHRNAECGNFRRSDCRAQELEVQDRRLGWVVSWAVRMRLRDSDQTATGHGWFIDPTPLDDDEFRNRVSTTQLYTDHYSAPDGRVGRQ